MEGRCEVKTQPVTDICEFIWVIMMLLTAGFQQDCCEISQGWRHSGPRRKHILGPCLPFRSAPPGLALHLYTYHLTRQGPGWGRCCQLGGVSLITAFPMLPARGLSSTGTGKSSKQMAPFHDLSQLRRESKPKLAWKTRLPEGPWNSSWNKTNENNHEQFVKMSQPAQTR